MWIRNTWYEQKMSAPTDIVSRINLFSCSHCAVLGLQAWLNAAWLQLCLLWFPERTCKSSMVTCHLQAKSFIHSLLEATLNSNISLEISFCSNVLILKPVQMGDSLCACFNGCAAEDTNILRHISPGGSWYESKTKFVSSLPGPHQCPNSRIPN